MPGSREHQAFLSLGGNIGNPRRALTAAMRLIAANPQTRVVKASCLYRTPPWGELRQPDFLNAAAEIATELAPHSLLRMCLEIEEKLMRIRSEKWGPRSIDIDILTYDNTAVRQTGLEIPHPRMLDRAFVLIPLAEIAPEMVIKGISVAARAETIGQAGFRLESEDGNWWED